MTTMTAVTSNEARTYRFTKVCCECAETFVTNVRNAKSCSTACRKSMNNRRAVRGAELYDLVMKMRFDRKTAAADGTWTHICALASAYNDADKCANEGRGRTSWDKNAHLDLPMAYSKEGDKR
jgi:triphosphoribosyl-dephospho-CoA synthetase